MLASSDVDQAAKDRLRQLYLSPNPIELRTRIEANLEKLWALER